MSCGRWRWAFALALALGCAWSPAPQGASSAARDGVLLPELRGPPRPPARLLLLSVAGLEPRHYRPAAPGAASTAMPTLGALADRGVYADAVETVRPASVHAIHASLVTGRRPNEHGIVADHLLGERGVRRARYEHATRLQGPSLWQTAIDARLSVASLFWPTTVGANIDFLLPDIRVARDGDDWLEQAAGASTPWLIERISSKASSRSGWPSSAERDSLVVDLACEIARSPTVPALWLLRLEQAGEAQQLYGPGSAAARRAFAEVDRLITQLARCLGQAGLLASSAILVTGDRAIAPVHTRIDPNVALARAGLIERGSEVASGIRAWLAVSRASGGSALVYAKREADAISARNALEAAARESGGFHVVPASELRERGVDSQAWFGIDAEPGYTFGDAARGPLVKASTARGASRSGVGEAAGRVGFVAWGRGIRSSVRFPLLRQLDIAPTAATLLGLHLREVEGRVLVGALEVSEGRPAARP